MNIEGKSDKQLRRMCVNHWKRNKKATEEAISKGKVNIGSRHCAFCAKYFQRYVSEDMQCEGCPVKNTTGKYGCIGTPYTHVVDIIDSYNKNNFDIKDWEDGCQEEIDFLEDLDL